MRTPGWVNDKGTWHVMGKTLGLSGSGVISGAMSVDMRPPSSGTAGFVMRSKDRRIVVVATPNGAIACEDRIARRKGKPGRIYTVRLVVEGGAITQFTARDARLQRLLDWLRKPAMPRRRRGRLMAWVKSWTDAPLPPLDGCEAER